MTRSAHTDRPLVVLSNDDGVSAEGLTILADELRGAFEILVVAPDRERSAMGHAITLRQPLHVTQQASDVYAVDGTPVDCVYLALFHLAQRRPALVIAGINNGYNLGTDVHYSGTVAGAAEAVIRGVPGVALSAGHGAGAETIRLAAGFACALVPWLLGHPLPTGVLLNVNVPKEARPCFRVGGLGQRTYQNRVEQGREGDGAPYVTIGGARLFELEGASGEDAESIRQGEIAVTPLKLDLTAREATTSLAGLTLDGFESSRERHAERP